MKSVKTRKGKGACAQRAVELIPYAERSKIKLTAAALSHCHSRAADLVSGAPQSKTGVSVQLVAGGVDCGVGIECGLREPADPTDLS